MAKKPVKFSELNAFTETAFKGNPAAACLLEEERSGMVAGQGCGVSLLFYKTLNNNFKKLLLKNIF